MRGFSQATAACSASSKKFKRTNSLQGKSTKSFSDHSICSPHGLNERWETTNSLNKRDIQQATYLMTHRHIVFTFTLWLHPRCLQPFHPRFVDRLPSSDTFQLSMLTPSPLPVMTMSEALTR